MTKRNNTLGLRLRKTIKSHQQFKQTTRARLACHQDRLNNMLASHRFMNEAVLALTEPERFEEYDDWHLGLFLHQRWVMQQAEQLKAELNTIKQSLKP
jgi:hypothetical protein